MKVVGLCLNFLRNQEAHLSESRMKVMVKILKQCQNQSKLEIVQRPNKKPNHKCHSIYTQESIRGR